MNPLLSSDGYSDNRYFRQSALVSALKRVLIALCVIPMVVNAAPITKKTAHSSATSRSQLLANNSVSPIDPPAEQPTDTLDTLVITPPNPQPLSMTALPSEPVLPAFDSTIQNGVPLPPSYGISVPSYLSLSQAQQYLVQVSPKVAADNAAIVSNERRAEATKNLNKPVIYLGASATHVHIDDKIDTTRLKDNLSQGINNRLDNALAGLPIDIPPLPVDIGSALTSPLPDSVPVKA